MRTGCIKGGDGVGGCLAGERNGRESSQKGIDNKSNKLIKGDGFLNSREGEVFQCRVAIFHLVPVHAFKSSKNFLIFFLKFESSKTLLDGLDA